MTSIVMFPATNTKKETKMSNYENATKTVKNKARNTEKIPYVRDLKELLVAVDTT